MKRILCKLLHVCKNPTIPVPTFDMGFGVLYMIVWNLRVI